MLLIKKGITKNRKGLITNSEAAKIRRKKNFLKKEVISTIYILHGFSMPFLLSAFS